MRSKDGIRTGYLLCKEVKQSLWIAAIWIYLNELAEGRPQNRFNGKEPPRNTQIVGSMVSTAMLTES